MRRFPFAEVALALACSGLAPGCGGSGCPEPRFAEPTVADGIQSGTTGDVVVVQWPASSGDPVPAGYYRTMELYDAPTEVDNVESTGDRELTVRFRSNVNMRDQDRSVPLRFEMQDTQAWVDCSHHGQADAYFVTLTLTFDGQGGVDAAFSEVSASHGDCSVRRIPDDTESTAAGLLALAVGAMVLRRRRVSLGR